ncbi:hypothetical protein DSO57_1025817 [Entomophthora muscae]|uniref:Uncharacterized protein n=1 Tax=Entomophthora muscae TaxID=34485 RepID=A0ACC2TDF7_9FUNG|nr:hypothetical protein DSO57_1025817 [Entomophthora muscae]
MLPLATYTKPSSSSLVWISSPLTITLHEWLLLFLKSALPRWVLGCLVLPPHVATLYATYWCTHQLLLLAALQSAKLLTRETLKLARLAKAEHLAAETARQENSELHQLRISSSLKDHVKEHVED